MDAFVLYHGAEAGDFRIQQRRRGLHGNCFGAQISDLQRHIDHHSLLNVQVHGNGDSFLEPGMFDGNGVAAHLERAGDVFARRVRCRGECGAALGVSHEHIRGGYHSAADVTHRAGNAAGILLRPRYSRGAQQQK